ncbi:RNA-binding protein 34-like isoform X3 [Oryx dammah]|nr:RNA-binding protein 34-like isoform X3 [Oryx dammah]
MTLEGKNKREKKQSAKEGENPDDGACGNLEGDYEVGQVANSLFRGKQPSRGSTGRLASLFRSVNPQLQPVYVPVPKEAIKKRKRDEEEESSPQIQRPLLQEPAKKMKMKKKLSDAEKKLANREDALASADLEEIHQKQGQKRKNSQPGVTVADKELFDDVEETVVNQRKKIQINQEEERLKNERTVFVGNLPVTCKKKRLKSFFKEYGQIESVRFRSLVCFPSLKVRHLKMYCMRKIHPDQKNINAYVVFKDESAATKALERNGAQFAEGFRVRVDLATETSSNTDAVHLALKLNNSELMGRKLRVMRSVHKEKLKQNSNPSLKNVSKPKQGLNFASKSAQNSKGLFIGEKAVLMKKKKKGQKKSRRSKTQKK